MIFVLLHHADWGARFSTNDDGRMQGIPAIFREEEKHQRQMTTASLTYSFQHQRIIQCVCVCVQLTASRKLSQCKPRSCKRVTDLVTRDIHSLQFW